MNTLLYIYISDLAYYWDLFSNYINMGSIFFWGFIGGIIGFSIIIILQILLRRKILVRRRYKILKYIAFLYFIFFPLFTGFCSSQWFTINTMEKQLIKNIPTILGESSTLFNKFLKEYMEENVGKENLDITANQGIENTIDYIMKSADSLNIDTSKVSKAINKISNFLQSEMIKDETKDKIADVISSNLSIDKDATKDLMNTKVNKILETGALNTFVEAKVKSIFDGFKLQLLIIFIIGMAIPISEIVLANYLERKRLKEESEKAKN